MRNRNLKLAKYYIAFAVALMCMGVGGHITYATSYIYDSNDGADLTKSVPYEGALQPYMCGLDINNFETEKQNYKNYYILHDGASNITRTMYLKKGILNVTLYGLDQFTGSVIIYEDSAKTLEVARLSLNTLSDRTDRGSYTRTDQILIPVSQEYYVEFTNSSGKEGVLQFASQQYSAGDQKITSEGIVGYVNSSTGPSYFQVDVEEDGTIAFNPKFYKNGKSINTYAYLTLTDAEKKEISVKRKIGTSKNAYAKKAIYGVRAGRYYLKVESPVEKIFTINCKYKQIWEDGEEYKEDAAVMKSGKWYSGFCVYGSTTSTGDYFKFKLKKPAQVSLTMKGNVCSGRIYAHVTSTKLNGKFNKVGIQKIGDTSAYYIRSSKAKKLPAGTYFVKICKDTKKTSGDYKIKLKIKK